MSATFPTFNPFGRDIPELDAPERGRAKQPKRVSPLVLAEQPTTILLSNQSHSDIISEYADYADIGELPREFHELTAIFLLSAILNQKDITVNYGGTRLSLDLWSLLLSGSGGGRGTALHTLDTIIGTSDIITGFGWGSGIAFKQKLAEYPYGADLWGEFSEKMQAFQSGKMGDVKTWLTDCHDNFRIPKTIEYRRTDTSRDTPPIEFLGAPRTNFLATSSETWLLENVEPSDVGGGWLSRFVILRSDNPRKDVPIPAALDSAKQARLIKLLDTVNRLPKGSVADITEIEKQITDWYGPTKTRFIGYDPHLGSAFFNRHRTNIIKIAIVFEVSMSGTLHVTPVAWERAARFMENVEATVKHLMAIGVSPRGNLLYQIEEAVRAAANGGISRRDLTRKFQRVDTKEREEAINTLVASGHIKWLEAKTAGRNAWVYKHETFVTSPVTEGDGRGASVNIRQHGV